MPWGVAAAAVGAAGGIYSANQAADTQSAAAGGAARANKPFKQSGMQGLSQLNALMGYAPTQFEQSQWAKQAKQELRPQLQALKQSGGTKADRQRLLSTAQKDFIAQRTAERQQGPDFGFLSQRFGADQFQADPGYQFRLQQGANQLQQGLASRGGLFSGAAGKALVDYGQNMATNEYTNAYNRFNADQGNLYNRAASMAGMGQTAVNQIGNYNLQGADARAAGQMGAWNALAGGIQSGGNYWQQQQAMNQPAFNYRGNSG